MFLSVSYTDFVWSKVVRWMVPLVAVIKWEVWHSWNRSPVHQRGMQIWHETCMLSSPPKFSLPFTHKLTLEASTALLSLFLKGVTSSMAELNCGSITSQWKHHSSQLEDEKSLHFQTASRQPVLVSEIIHGCRTMSKHLAYLCILQEEIWLVT